VFVLESNMCVTLETVWSFKLTLTCITQYGSYIVI